MLCFKFPWILHDMAFFILNLNVLFDPAKFWNKYNGCVYTSCQTDPLHCKVSFHGAKFKIQNFLSIYLCLNGLCPHYSVDWQSVTSSHWALYMCNLPFFPSLPPDWQWQLGVLFLHMPLELFLPQGPGTVVTDQASSLTKVLLKPIHQ